MFRFKKCLFAKRISLIKPVLWPPVSCIRLAPSVFRAVYYSKIELGWPLTQWDLSGVPDLSREEVLQVLVVGVYDERIARSR